MIIRNLCLVRRTNPFLSDVNLTNKLAITKLETIVCCIFQPVFGCCAPQALVEIVIFSIFYAKKLKKVTNLQHNQAKNLFF